MGQGDPDTYMVNQTFPGEAKKKNQADDNTMWPFFNTCPV